MKRVYSCQKIEIWEIAEAYGPDFYVYDSGKLLRVCPSIGMAMEVASGQID